MTAWNESESWTNEELAEWAAAYLERVDAGDQVPAPKHGIELRHVVVGTVRGFEVRPMLFVDGVQDMQVGPTLVFGHEKPAMVEAETKEEALNLAASSDGRALVSGEELVINDSFQAMEVKP